MSLPASITGAHAKKQGEDLSDNDGDEDEGIFHGEEMVHEFFCPFNKFLFHHFFFSIINVLLQFADSNIKRSFSFILTVAFLCVCVCVNAASALVCWA